MSTPEQASDKVSEQASEGGTFDHVPRYQSRDAKRVDEPRFRGSDGRIEMPMSGLDRFAIFCACCLTVCAAYFSIRGMTVLFPGAPLAVMCMAVSMEMSKLVMAGWLAYRWQQAAGIWKLVLVVLIFGVAVINASGVYSQLVAAHVGEKASMTASFQTEDAGLSGQIDIANSRVSDIDRRLAQIDGAIEGASRRGRSNQSLNLMQEQRRNRASLAREREQAFQSATDLRTQRAGHSARGQQIETEAAPIRYVSELLGWNADPEKVIRWLIALVVVCCDPLAISICAGVASARRWRRTYA